MHQAHTLPEASCLSRGADVTVHDSSAFLDTTRCKHWAHKIFPWKYSLSESLFRQLFPEPRAPRSWSPPWAPFRGCWSPAAAATPDLILVEAGGEWQFPVGRAHPPTHMARFYSPQLHFVWNVTFNTSFPDATPSRHHHRDLWVTFRDLLFVHKETEKGSLLVCTRLSRGWTRQAGGDKFLSYRKHGQQTAPWKVRTRARERQGIPELPVVSCVPDGLLEESQPRTPGSTEEKRLHGKHVLCNPGGQ